MYGTNQNTAYREGEMGCAQEAFSEILSLMHREHVHPPYIEAYV